MKTSTKNSITLIGDVHQKYDRYHKIIRQKDRHPYTVQLGDFGLSKFETLDNVDSTCHKILGGNHCNYDKIIHLTHWLGDYGYTCLNGVSFFYLRGAYSIDRMWRTVGIDWWEEEEITHNVFEQAKEFYAQVQPDVVLTHTCPDSITKYLIPPGGARFNSRTEYYLEELFQIHKPKEWRFGHWHTSWNKNVEGTNFRCLAELETEIFTI
jgi:hypothetical protein